MSEWMYLQEDPAESLARLHFFSVRKKHASGDIETRITVHEFASPPIGALQFFAMADIELNQKTAKYKPSGWSDTLMGALSECLKNLRKFEYEGPELGSAASGD